VVIPAIPEPTMTTSILFILIPFIEQPLVNLTVDKFGLYLYLYY